MRARNIIVYNIIINSMAVLLVLSHGGVASMAFLDSATNCLMCQSLVQRKGAQMTSLCNAIGEAELRRTCDAMVRVFGVDIEDASVNNTLVDSMKTTNDHNVCTSLGLCGNSSHVEDVCTVCSIVSEQTGIETSIEHVAAFVETACMLLGSTSDVFDQPQCVQQAMTVYTTYLQRRDPSVHVCAASCHNHDTVWTKKHELMLASFLS